MKAITIEHVARFLLASAVLLWAGALSAQTPSPAVNPHTIPTVNGDIGSCTVLFTVTNGKGAPIYNAKVRVHISHGFFGAHKLDLEVGTNIDGKARFSGLPDKMDHALHFLASKDDLDGSAFYDTSHNCNAKHEIVLLKQDSSAP